MAEATQETLTQVPPLLQFGKMTEFEVGQPSIAYNIPLAAAPVTLAATSVLVSEPGDRVWLNGTVNWFVSYSGTGTVDVRFDLVRDGTVINSVVQTLPLVFSPVAGTIQYAQATVQYVDQPLTTRGLRAVLYQLQATRVAGTFSTQATTLTTLTAAQVKANTPL